MILWQYKYTIIKLYLKKYFGTILSLDQRNKEKTDFLSDGDMICETSKEIEKQKAANKVLSFLCISSVKYIILREC